MKITSKTVLGIAGLVVATQAVAQGYDYRRHGDERLYEAQVVAVHAVVGPPEQRCWVERQQVVEENRGAPNVGGAIAGAVIGGILGHQIGGGRGQDIATAGGAVGGIGWGLEHRRGGAQVWPDVGAVRDARRRPRHRSRRCPRSPPRSAALAHRPSA